MHVGSVLLLLHLLVLLLLLLRLRLVHTLMMVSLRGVQAGCTQQGSALPEQRCHLHPGCCVVRVVGFTGNNPPSAGVAKSLALLLLLSRSRRPADASSSPKTRTARSRIGTGLSNPSVNTVSSVTTKAHRTSPRFPRHGLGSIPALEILRRRLLGSRVVPRKVLRIA